MMHNVCLVFIFVCIYTTKSTDHLSLVAILRRATGWNRALWFVGSLHTRVCGKTWCITTRSLVWAFVCFSFQVWQFVFLLFVSVCFALLLFCFVLFRLFCLLCLFVWLFVCFFIFYWHGLDMPLWCLMLTDVVCFCWLIVPYRNIIHSVLTLGFISWVWLILARIFGLGILLSLFEQGNPRAIHRTSIFMMILFDTSSNQVCQKKRGNISTWSTRST